MNEFKKKQGARIGLSLIALIAASLFLTGLVGGKNMTYRIGEETPVVTASQQGFGGQVTVHAGLNGDKTIKTLSIETPDETAGLGQRASEEEFTAQFIGKAGPFTFGEDGIEALSGATITSNAALKAINSALSGETAEEKPAEEKPAEEKPAEEKPAEEKPAEEKPAEEKPAEEKPAEEKPVEGDSYVSEKETPYSKIRVEVTAKDGKIVDCKITSKEKEPDFDFLTAKAKKEWAEAIVAAQTAETDVITGATLKLSSGAVREAMTEILGQMNGGAQETEKPAEEKPAEEKPAEEKPAEVPAAVEKAEKAPAMFGGYLSVKETDYSVIRVIVSTRNGVITGCTITSEEKSKGSDFLKDSIRKEWADAIVAAQTAETDAITGATLKLSSAAVREAVAELLETIGGK